MPPKSVGEEKEEYLDKEGKYPVSKPSTYTSSPRESHHPNVPVTVKNALLPIPGTSSSS